MEHSVSLAVVLKEDVMILSCLHYFQVTHEAVAQIS